MKPIRCVLVAIDAKYAHTNLAVRSIAAYAGLQGLSDIAIQEFTVNQRVDVILASLYREEAGIYLFSTYIWNVELVCQIAAELRKIRPGAIIAAGGPEVSYGSTDFLLENPSFDFVVRGEGEVCVTALLQSLGSGNTIEGYAGVTLRQEDGTVLDNGLAQVADLDELPFAYRDFDALKHRVPYYESMRGCPFSCGYCLSSVESGVRYRSLDLVFQDLQKFLEARVRRVKFVDRTFNCDQKRALAIWRFLAREDNGITNFHFELSGNLLDGETLSFLQGIRPGLFQFEIGVQSLNRDTLSEIRRVTDTPLLLSQIKELQSFGNIHLHLDLIAGLPCEDFDSFRRSFNTIYGLGPAQLQLGFLKVLKGSAMEVNARKYGLLYRDRAPYEVLETRWLTYGELQVLKGVEEMVEVYYNSGRFSHIVQHLCGFFPDSFSLFYSLWELWLEQGYGEHPPSKTGYYELLGILIDKQNIPDKDRAAWLCKYDMLSHEKIVKLPKWINVDGTAVYKQQIRNFYRDGLVLREILTETAPLSGKELERHMHLEVFPFHPVTGIHEPVAILFCYLKRDLLGHAHTTALSQGHFPI